MAKDPAFLFYPGDWIGGTIHMTHLEKGCYFDLLMLQFHKGKFTEAHAKHMLNGSFDLAWPNIKDKFETDGSYFWNKRLDFEKTRRANFTSSRRKNAEGETVTEEKPVSKKKKKINKSSTSEASAKHMQEHMPDHMDTHMENENENKNVIKNEDKGGVGEKEDSVLEIFKDYYQEFILQKTGAKPKWDGSEVKAAKSIISYLNTLETVKSDEQLLNGWRVILKQWHKLSDYQRQKIKLTEINSDIIKIIDQIKNNNGNAGPVRKTLESTIKVSESRSFGEL